MSQKIIDTLNDGETPFYDQRVQLEGAEYEMQFSWNTRADHWYLRVETIDGEELIASRAIVNDVDLFRGCASANRPPGALIAIPLNRSDNRAAGLKDLGRRVQLIYIPSDDPDFFPDG